MVMLGDNIPFWPDKDDNSFYAAPQEKYIMALPNGSKIYLPGGKEAFMTLEDIVIMRLTDIITP